MENKMEEVAKMFGVEIGEKFKIQYISGSISDCYYYFTENGIYGDEIGRSYGSQFLLNLLIGDYTILKNPWKPSIGKPYWVVHPDGYVYNIIYSGCHEDNAYYKLGNFYPNKEEAEANREKWVAFYASDEVLKV